MNQFELECIFGLNGRSRKDLDEYYEEQARNNKLRKFMNGINKPTNSYQPKSDEKDEKDDKK
jgi:hypothetical protein